MGTKAKIARAVVATTISFLPSGCIAAPVVDSALSKVEKWHEEKSKKK